MKRPSEIAEHGLRGAPAYRGDKVAVAHALLDLRKSLRDMRGAVVAGNERLAVWIDAMLDERKEKPSDD